MRLAIYWNDILHYHAARISALYQLAEEAGHTVHAFALRPASPELPIGGYHNLLSGKIKVLSEDPLADEYSSVSKQNLLRALDETNPDAVAIVGYTGAVSRAAMGWCRYHGKGAILMFESHAADYTRIRWKEFIKRRLVSWVDAAFVSGQLHAAYVNQLGMTRERIVPNCSVVDNEFWLKEAAKTRSDPDQWHSKYQLPDKFFLTACRFILKKNLTGLINAYAKYVQKTPSNPWALVIVGDGELASMLQQQVTDLDLNHLVHFPGYLSAHETARFYGLATAFVLASSHAEQWGLVVNEAMAAGLPVLVSNICGCVPDLVIEGETGYSFDPNDEENLSKLLQHISSNAEHLTTLGQNAQNHIQNLSLETFARNLFKAGELAIQHAESRWWPLWPHPSLWL